MGEPGTPVERGKAVVLVAAKIVSLVSEVLFIWEGGCDISFANYFLTIDWNSLIDEYLSFRLKEMSFGPKKCMT